MAIKVKLAKYLMKLRPSKQIFNPDIFKQEYYKHDKFLSLNDEEKKKQQIEFSKVEFLPVSLYSRSFISNRYKIIKHLTNAINPLLRIKLLIDYLSHRLVYILKV